MVRRSEPWFVKSPALYQELNKQIRQDFRTLHLITKGEIVFVRGALPIISIDGDELDRYQIEIELPVDFPVSVPQVREVGSKIPRILDRHVNSNGTACLFVRDKAWKYWNKNTTLIDFIKGPVYQFFLGQTYYSLNKVWPFGHYKHGADGVAEYYYEELNTPRLKVVIAFLEFLAVIKVDNRLRCYCGSQRQLKECHLNKVLSMRAHISCASAARSLKEIMVFEKCYPSPPQKPYSEILGLAQTVSLIPRNIDSYEIRNMLISCRNNRDN